MEEPQLDVIGGEVAEALELHDIAAGDRCERGLGLARQHDLGVAVEIVEGFAGALAGNLRREQSLVERDPYVDCVSGGDPVDRRLHLATLRRVAAARLRVVRALHLGDVALRVSRKSGALDEERTTQPHFRTGREAVVLRRWLGHEVVGFDPQLAGELHVAGSVGGVLRIVLQRHRLDVSCRPVGDDQLDRTQHGHAALRSVVELVADEPLEQFDLVAAIRLRHADEFAELADRRRRVAPPTQRAQRWQSRVVPTVDHTVVDQLTKFALRCNCVCQLEARELGLLGLVARQRQVLEVPVVQRAMTVELQRAQ